MQLSDAARQVSLSVREFAEFRVGMPTQHMHRQGIWRAQLGTAWHTKVQQQVAAQSPEARFEIPIEGRYIHQGWTLTLRGRIDQVIAADDHCLLREVKTTSLALPVAEEVLREKFPHYYNQIATYLTLAYLLPEYKNKALRGELCLVDITHGIAQNISVDKVYETLFQARLKAWLPFLEELWQSKARIQSLSFNPAFPSPRPGQSEAQEGLQSAVNQGKVVLFEAPTGFGKTGTALEFALRQLKQGRYQRAIYLTGKSTGQLQAMRQIKNMVTDEGALRYFQLRNKREHANRCNLSGCDAYKSCTTSLNHCPTPQPLNASDLFHAGTLTLEQIGLLSAHTQICPYELSRLTLGFAEVWFCDYNYIFAPENQGILFNQPGFSPPHTLLIIDEAHNLPARVQDIYSALVTHDEAAMVEAELFNCARSPKFRTAWVQWMQFLASIQPNESLNLNCSYELIERVDDLVQLLNQTPIDYNQLSSFTNNNLFSLYRLNTILQHDGLKTLLWSGQPGQLHLTCLDAAAETARQIAPFATTLLMSATLSPTDFFLQKTGLSPDSTPCVKAYTPWRDHAYSVAIDARIDTRLKARSNYYPTTAQTILDLTEHTTAPVVVFFPSYRYAETIETYLKAANPYTQICMQPRAIDLNGQMRFVEESLLTAHVLCFVLGSSFSESIDHLGGKIEYTIVVGPALPEVNPIQKAHLNSHAHLGQTQAFQRTYQIPAMQKINQALGRLVRAPGQQTRVLLHCRRFADPGYQQLLNPEYQAGMTIHTQDGLAAWLG